MASFPEIFYISIIQQHIITCKLQGYVIFVI